MSDLTQHHPAHSPRHTDITACTNRGWRFNTWRHASSIIKSAPRTITSVTQIDQLLSINSLSSDVCAQCWEAVSREDICCKYKFQNIKAEKELRKRT